MTRALADAIERLLDDDELVAVSKALALVESRFDLFTEAQRFGDLLLLARPPECLYAARRVSSAERTTRGSGRGDTSGRRCPLRRTGTCRASSPARSRTSHATLGFPPDPRWRTLPKLLRRDFDPIPTDTLNVSFQRNPTITLTMRPNPRTPQARAAGTRPR
jgi:hypothetical protein